MAHPATIDDPRLGPRVSGLHRRFHRRQRAWVDIFGRLGARLASFTGLAEVLFAVLYAWLLLGQLPSPLQFIGGAFMLAGVILVRADENRQRDAD